MPLDLLEFNAHPGEDLVFLGRISPEKRVDRAIDIARRAGRRLRIAAKVDEVDEAYFEERVAPLFEDPRVEFVGEINDAEKSEFLGEAGALLFPIDWPEPFGLVMIEAMACGTPVIAYPNGSAPEVIDEGRTGYLVRSPQEAAEAVERALRLDRAQCRRAFEQRFDVTRMAIDYMDLYNRLITGCSPVLAGSEIEAPY